MGANVSLADNREPLGSADSVYIPFSCERVGGKPHYRSIDPARGQIRDTSFSDCEFETVRGYPAPLPFDEDLPIETEAQPSED